MKSLHGYTLTIKIVKEVLYRKLLCLRCNVRVTYTRAAMGRRLCQNPKIRRPNFSSRYLLNVCVKNAEKHTFVPSFALHRSA